MEAYDRHREQKRNVYRDLQRRGDSAMAGPSIDETIRKVHEKSVLALMQGNSKTWSAEDQGS